MTSQPIAEEFPATAETLAVPRQQKAGSLVLIESVGQIPQQADSPENIAPEAAKITKGEPANKYALSFLGVITKGYELPQGITQQDAEMFTDMTIGLINEIRSRKGSRREADEAHRLFARGYSDQEISGLLGNTRSKTTLSVMRCLDIKVLHERGYRPRKLHSMLENFVALEEGPAVHPIKKVKPEILRGHVNPRTSRFFKSLLKIKELPEGLTQKDAEIFTEMVLGLIDGIKESRISRKEVDEEVRLYTRGRSNKEISELIGFTRSSDSIKIQRTRDINVLHERGYPPVVLNYLLDKFLAKDIEEETYAVPAAERRTYKRRAPRTDTSGIEGLEQDSEIAEVELIETDDKDDLDVPAHTTDIVRSYLTDIGRVPLLTAEQEVLLAKQIEAARPAMDILKLIKEEHLNVAPEIKEILLEDAIPSVRATKQMMEANLRLVVHWATRYQGKGLELLDLIQEGNIGLARGVEKFDYTKGYKFSTYATWWIRQALQRAIADQGSAIRIPVHMHEQINKAVKVKARLEDSLGRKPTVEEIAEIIEKTPEKTEEILSFKKPMIYLDRPVGEDKDSTLGDFIPDKEHKEAIDEVAFGQMQDKLTQLLNTLPERSKIVIAMRFGLTDGHPRTLDEVGKELGLTRERIRQIEIEVMRDMRKPDSPFQQFKDYVQTA